MAATFDDVTLGRSTDDVILNNDCSITTGGRSCAKIFTQLGLRYKKWLITYMQSYET